MLLWGFFQHPLVLHALVSICCEHHKQHPAVGLREYAMPPWQEALKQSQLLPQQHLRCHAQEAQLQPEAYARRERRS